ncbi:hypothetical protein VNO78_26192 [Psophocarpus tetragonolobus]|uniref:Uncharacterized protein n=1 Tax=Psophocarpus tetragonolobus TaxID=3891 RepID=A0AAN9RZY8_PSOTE
MKISFSHFVMPLPYPNFLSSNRARSSLRLSCSDYFPGNSPGGAPPHRSFSLCLFRNPRETKFKTPAIQKP